MKKIKIFLGAYVNFPNAQNINCDNIAKYLDKETFEVHTMYTDRMPIDKDEYEKQGIHLHRLIHHRFIWWWCKYLTMLFGNYDIYYLPKMESVDIVFARRCKNVRKLFVSSVEGVITETICGEKEYRDYFLCDMDGFWAISKSIKDSIEFFWNIQDVPIIPLGVADIPIEVNRTHTEIKKIIWVGTFDENKRPYYLLECAEHFPNIQFTMIGDGELLEEVQRTCKMEGVHNVFFTGRIPNNEVYDLMIEHDLLLMTSRHEGLPKVVQEAALCGLPSIYFDEVYSIDYIEQGVNGYAVACLGEMIEKIQFLINNPDKYCSMSLSSYEEIQRYQWKNIIWEYEQFLLKSYGEKNLQVKK